MTNQINLKLSDRMFSSATKYAEENGFDNLQELVRELLREKLFSEEKISGIYTYKASEASLAKLRLTKEEYEAWKHLQKEI